LADVDFKYGEGDNLPTVNAVVKVGGSPLPLTGFTGTLKVAPENSTTVDVRTVTINPDQVANPGAISFSFFDPGVATPGFYEARVKLADGSGNRISFDGDRLLRIQITRDPGTPD
jgi:hypothetical protein